MEMVQSDTCHLLCDFLEGAVFVLLIHLRDLRDLRQCHCLQRLAMY